MKRPATTVLRDAEDLVLRGKRQHQYGDPITAHERVAAVWSILAGKQITPRQVALMFATAKILRTFDTVHEDSVMDAAGYLLIASLCAEAEDDQ